MICLAETCLAARDADLPQMALSHGKGPSFEVEQQEHRMMREVYRGLTPDVRYKLTGQHRLDTSMMD